MCTHTTVEIHNLETSYQATQPDTLTDSVSYQHIDPWYLTDPLAKLLMQMTVVHIPQLNMTIWCKDKATGVFKWVKNDQTSGFKAWQYVQYMHKCTCTIPFEMYIYKRNHFCPPNVQFCTHKSKTHLQWALSTCYYQTGKKLSHPGHIQYTAHTQRYKYLQAITFL